MLRRYTAFALVAGLLLFGGAAARGQVVNSQWVPASGNWNVAGNWSPVAAPDNGGGFTYNVQIGTLAPSNAQVTFVPVAGTSATITSLNLTDGADLFTNGFQLNVTGQTTIDGAGTTIRVDPHATPGTASLTTLDLDLNNGGALVMNGGVAAVATQLEVNATSTLQGFGRLNFGDADGAIEQAFDNSGLIQVLGTSVTPGTLTLHTNGVDTIDLDGDSELGVVDVSNAVADLELDTLTLIVDGPLADGFGSAAPGAQLQIGQRDTITFNRDFEIDAAAMIIMDGGTNVATMNGPGKITDIAGAAFSVTGAAVIDNDMAFTGTASTFSVAASGSLTLGGTVTMADASMLTLGTGAQLIVTGATTITEAGAAADFNWDGTGNNATTTIDGSGHLTLNVDQVDVGDNIFNGTINLNGGGDLTVNNTINSWQASGVVNKNGAGTSSINGDEFALSGDLNVNAGTLDVNAPAVFGTTSDVVIAAGAIADMATTEIFNGADVTVNGTLSLGLASVLEAPATLTGTGLFRFNSTSTVTANAVVNTTSFDWDGTGSGTTHTINNGVVFTVNSTIWDADDATPGVDDNINLGGNGAQIIVNNVAQWTMARTLNANTALAGTATIGGTSPFVLEGALAVLNVDGNTNINSPVTFGASSTASIDAAMTLNLGANAAYQGGTIGGAGTFLPASNNLVTANSTISAANFDFDAGNWVIQNNAELTVNVTDYETGAGVNAFNGTINLNNGTISVTTGDAEFVMDGILNATASGVDQSLWTGEALDIGNDAGVLDADVNISGAQPTQFGAQVDFNSDADLNVTDGATVHFLDVVNFNSVNGGNNAEFTGSGEMIFSAGVNFSEATHLNMVGGTVDLDGADSIGDTINIDAPLTINAELMRSFGKVNGGGGTNLLDINNSVNAGTLTVTLDAADAEWTLNSQGVMNLVNDNAVATLLAGNALNVNGTLNITGNVRTTARLDIGSTAVVNINTAGQPLRLAGGDAVTNLNTIAGGTINGVGILAADNDIGLRGFGTINTQIDFDGSASLYADDGTLAINGAILDANTLVALSDGVINVANAWNNNVVGAISLFGGELAGGAVTNDTVLGIGGNGLVSARVINNSRLRGHSGGTLIVQTAGNDNDWDGAGAGRIVADGADVEIRDIGPAFAFTGDVEVMTGRRVFANGFALDFNVGSELTITAGTYESTSSTDIGGTVTVNAGAASTIKVANNSFLTFEAGSATSLNGDLRLLNNNIIFKSGAIFSGVGALTVPDGSHAVIDAGATVNALYVNQGALRVANSEGIGVATVKDYVQSATGDLFVELTGTLPNQFDRIQVTGVAQIAGYLNVDIDGAFVPALGNTFDIISTAFGVSGAFDYMDVSGMPAGLAFKINYLPNAVRLQVVAKPIFSADFDDDGDVDPTDLAIWKGAYHLNQLGDADGDNDSDGFDFLLWQQQAGSHPAVAAQAAVPEPDTALLIVVAAIASGIAKRRRAVR